MGVRLYPNTGNVKNLEILAGVAPGTASRLEDINKKHQQEKIGVSGVELYDLEYTQWKEINKDKDLGEYSAFLLYGWWKFQHLPGVTSGYAGSIYDSEHVRKLLALNGIEADPNLTEGVHWC